MNRITILSRREAAGIDDVISDFLREMRLTNGINRQRVFSAWDAVSGAKEYTSGKYLKNGVLYCNVNSSVVRSRLAVRKKNILDGMNSYIASDSFSRMMDRYGQVLRIKDIVLR